MFSVGGHDRGIYQWRTLGMNQEDWTCEKDKLVVASLEHLIIDRRWVREDEQSAQ